jgi:hypothetical protein
LRRRRGSREATGSMATLDEIVAALESLERARKRLVLPRLK